MSLSDLLKMRHKQGETPSILPIIERHFIQSSAFDREKWEEKGQRFHPSKLSYWGACARSYALFMLRDELKIEFEPPTPHKTSLLRIFEMGHTIHSMYQDKILPKTGSLYGKWVRGEDVIEGFYPGEGWSYQEVRVWWPRYRLSGYIDGIVLISGKWFVLEIKSCNDNSFRYLKNVLKEPRSYHKTQSQLYVFADKKLDRDIDLQGSIVLYVNKDSGEELDFYVPRDKESIEGILNDIDQAIEAVENKIVPNRVSDCKTYRSKRAKDCFACGACFSREDWNGLI